VGFNCVFFDGILIPLATADPVYNHPISVATGAASTFSRSATFTSSNKKPISEAHSVYFKNMLHLCNYDVSKIGNEKTHRELSSARLSLLIVRQ
jgi:hypothetical protein